MKVNTYLIKCLVVITSILLFYAPDCSAQENANRFGGGIHYWKTIDDLKEEGSEFDEDGISWIVSYQYVKQLVKMETAVEVFPNGYYGSEHTAIVPQALMGIGTFIYGAAGIGTVYAKDFDDTFEGPIYILRAGLDLGLLPQLHLDINANYYFSDWEKVDDVDTDTITFGALLRFAF